MKRVEYVRVDENGTCVSVGECVHPSECSCERCTECEHRVNVSGYQRWMSRELVVESGKGRGGPTESSRVGGRDGAGVSKDKCLFGGERRGK